MDIKDSYLHDGVGVVKSISIDADKLSYKLADTAGTVREVTLPVATLTANGLLSSEDKTKLDNMIATKVANDLILKINSGTTEGTSLYTYNGSSAKTLDIKSGTGIGFTNNAGLLQIYNSGVRSIATGITNGTISVNTNGASVDVAVKGLGSAAYLNRNLLANYTAGTTYIAFNLYDSSLHSLGLDDGYIEYYDDGAWYNSKWGWVEAVNGFKGSLTGNAATATKLKTKRKLWGLDFDGSADVSGNMTGVGSINMTDNITIQGTNLDRFLNFYHDFDNPSNSWRIGYIGTGAGNDNLLSFESSGSDTVWKPALLIYNDTRDAVFTGTVTAPTFIGNLDGTYVDKLTGYSKATAIIALAATDTLNTALGKLEYKADVVYDLVKGAYDGDGTIENLAEILKVLEDIKDTDTIQALVGKYLPLAGGAMDSTANISWKDRNAWGNSSAEYPYSYGGLKWFGTSDWIKIYGKEEASDKLNLIVEFGDDADHSIKLIDNGVESTIWHTRNLTKVSQLTNDMGYLTSIPSHSHNNYLPRHTYTIPKGKSLRITFAGPFNAIIYGRCTLGDGSLILIGNGYGENRIRNSWTQLSNGTISWSVPNSDSYSNTIEIQGKSDHSVDVEILSKITPTFAEISALTSSVMDNPVALKSQIPTKTSQLTNDSGYITSYTDTAAGKTFKTLSGVSHSAWTDNKTDDKIIPTMSFIAYWNGAYASNNASNLTYSANGVIIGSSNYTTYTVKKDGTGATGTWGINITGNANTLDGYDSDSFLHRLRRTNLNISSSYSGMVPYDILGLKNGYPIYTDPEFANGNNNIQVYNNSGGSAVTITRESSTTSGNSSGYCLHIKSAASGASPNGGGFLFGLEGTKARVAVCIFRALIPTSYSVVFHTNSIGSGGDSGWLTNLEGTGKYEWYAYMVEWGESPSSSFYFTLNKAAKVDWYLSYANIIDVSRASYDGLRTRYSDSSISAGKANYIESQGRSTAISGTTKPTNNGLTVYEIYNNGYPTTYGNLLLVKGGSGSGELALGWAASDNCGNIYYRSIRDNTNSWSSWKLIAFTSDIPTVTNYYWANIKISSSSNSDTSPTFSHAIFNRVTDHGINVGTIRGMKVGSRTGEFIHMYERVHIGSPSGWGSLDAPSYGLSTYGGAWLATNTGNVGIGTTNPASKLHVSGNLTIDNGSIYYQGSHAIYPMIKFINNVSDGYGNGIAIGGGGLTIVGSGESSDLFYTAGSGGGETLILSSDEAIVLYSNCQEGTSKAKSITLDTNGYLNTSYIHYGGHEKNNSNPSYVAGFNASDSYIRSYATSSLSVNYANSAGWANSSANADGLASTGYGNGNFTYYQTDGSFFDNSGWTHYLIANHGDGKTYYNFTIGLPFWGVPIYKRLEGGTADGWHTFITSENISSQSVNYATSAGNADTVDGEHSSAFAHIGTYNNLTHSGNEFTFASSAFSGAMWINYRTASGNTDGNITQYTFGNGKGGLLAYISSGYFSGAALYAYSALSLSGGSIATWGTLTAANGYTNVCTWDTGNTTGAFSLAGKGGQMSLQLDGFFYQNEGQYLVLDTNNYSSTLNSVYAPKAITDNLTNFNVGLTDGYINNFKSDSISLSNTSAQITRSGANVSWYQGRKYALLKTTSYTGYGPVISMKTSTGDWSLGVYSDDYAYLTFITDTNYNNSTNSTTYQLKFPKTDGTLATTSDLGSYLPLSGGTMAGAITTPGDDSVVIKPAKNNYDQIGASDCVFWKIHATTFIGSLSGNASSASKLNTDNGTNVKPVYFSGGVPVTCSYEIGCVKATKIETTSTTPKYLLGVTNDGYLWTYYHTTAYVNSNGVFWSSDRRLKDNIKSPVKNGMLNDETGLIRKFTWKDSGNASYGFIAQELMLHIPEAVDYDETLNKYSVNYDVAHSALIAQLVIKVKELESEISKLKQLIN